MQTIAILLILCPSLLLGLSDGNVEPRDIFDDADDLLREFEATVRSVVTKAANQLRETENDVASLGQAVNNIGVRIITQIQRELLQELDDLDARSQLAGYDVTGCTYGAKRDISRWPAALINQIQQCITYRTEESLESVHQAFANLDNANRTVQELADRLQSCKMADDAVCATTVYSQISLQNDMLPLLLEADIREVLALYTDMESYFQQCTDSPTSSMRSTGRTIVNSAIECAHNIMSG